jgi:hypothetical protein
MDSTQPPEPVPATPATRRCTLYAAAAGVGALALSVATFLTQPRTDEHYALPCLLLAIGLLLMVAAFVANGGSFRCSRGTLALGELEPGAKLLILGAAALSIEITIRLLASKRFGGHISNFDFGLKNDGEHNRAFTPSFNSFGHCIQGCLSVLLVPAVELALPWSELTLIVSCFVSCFVAVYPTYNLVKRALDASAFAASSFSNNAAEWAMGFWLGLSLGVLVAARAPAPPEPEICLPRVAAGVLLCLVSLIAAVLYGVSWDSTGNGATGEDAVDLALLIVFLAVPLGLAAVYALCTCYVRCVGDCLFGSDIFDQTFNPESGSFWHKHNAAKRDLRAARRRAGV